MVLLLLASLARAVAPHSPPPTDAPPPEPPHDGGHSVAIVGGAVGFDYQTVQWWAGPSLAVVPANHRGLAFQGRLVPAFAIPWNEPMLFTEAGAALVTSTNEATVRVGGTFSPVFVHGDYRMPVEFGDLDKGPIFGMLWGGMFTLELEWGMDAPFTLGAHIGPASSVSDYQCELKGTEDYTTCRAWATGLAGGFLIRKRWKDDVALEVQLGLSSSVTVGYSF